MYACLKPYNQRLPERWNAGPDRQGRSRNNLLVVPCGYCKHCRTNKVNQIIGKLMAQSLICSDVWAFTLTCDDNAPEPFGEHARKLARVYTPEPLKHMMKSLRRDADRSGQGGNFTYWFQYENGSKKARGHMHGFIFWHSRPDLEILRRGDLDGAARNNPQVGWLPPHTRDFIRGSEALKASLADPQVINLRVGQKARSQKMAGTSGHRSNMTGYQQYWKYWPYGRLTVESLFRPQGIVATGGIYKSLRYAAKYCVKGQTENVHANEPAQPDNINHGQSGPEERREGESTQEWKLRIKKEGKEDLPPPRQSNQMLFGVHYAKAQAEKLAEGGFGLNYLTYSFVGQTKRLRLDQQKKNEETIARGHTPDKWQETGEQRRFTWDGKRRDKFMEFYAICYAKTHWPQEYQAQRALYKDPVQKTGARQETAHYWRKQQLDTKAAFTVWMNRYKEGKTLWPWSTQLTEYIRRWWLDQSGKEADKQWFLDLENKATGKLRESIADKYNGKGVRYRIGRKSEIYLHPDGSAWYRRIDRKGTLYWRAITTALEEKAAIEGRLPRQGAWVTELEVYGRAEDGTPRQFDNAQLLVAAKNAEQARPFKPRPLTE